MTPYGRTRHCDQLPKPNWFLRDLPLQGMIGGNHPPQEGSLTLPLGGLDGSDEPPWKIGGLGVRDDGGEKKSPKIRPYYFLRGGAWWVGDYL